MNMIDLRSDTVTRPTDRMREAMASAEVGDDVFREDPTVNRLEDITASLFEKEAALFFPTGTMANQVAISAWTEPAQEILLEEKSHIYNFELGMFSVASGVVPRSVSSGDGEMPISNIKQYHRSEGPFTNKTALITIENTHNMHGGRIISQQYLQNLSTFASSHQTAVHLDGARVFHAAVTKNQSLSSIATHADSLMCSLSKGLSAPAGSMLVGSKPFVQECIRIRKQFGGGMRQAGILAAAGIEALNHMRPRLEEDHNHADMFARGLQHHNYLEVDLNQVETNIVLARWKKNDNSIESFVEQMTNQHVQAVAVDQETIRFVFHRHISQEDVEKAIDSINSLEGIS